MSSISATVGYKIHSDTKSFGFYKVNSKNHNLTFKIYFYVSIFRSTHNLYPIFFFLKATQSEIIKKLIYVKCAQAEVVFPALNCDIISAKDSFTSVGHDKFFCITPTVCCSVRQR